jgi:lipopolysaccharide export LptBFGC system permease protein LptF
MNPVTKNLQIERNNFSKWLYLGFTALSGFAFFISFNKAGNNKWISFAGIVLFGSVYWAVLKSRITTGQDGLQCRVHSDQQMYR